MSDDMKELTRVIENLTSVIEEQNKLTKHLLLQNQEIQSNIIQVKNYLRILTDQYQKDAGIKTITMEDK